MTELNTQPTADVTIGLSSNDTTEGTVLPASLTFTSSNWNTAQTVTVTGVDDQVVDGNVAYTIATAAAVSTDTNYSGLNAADVTAINIDNDMAGITVSPTSGLVTTEAGGTATFTVKLNTCHLYTTLSFFGPKASQAVAKSVMRRSPTHSGCGPGGASVARLL
jgi:hypothetical protein